MWVTYFFYSKCTTGIPKLSQEYAGVANIKLIHQIREFQDNLKAVHKAKALIDFVTSDHTGLSFRVFEALGYGKKLITTNVEVAHYDFYHPNNIFIWDGQDLEGIEAFMRKPYMPIDPDIKEKYSFSNWIRYILNLEPYKEITLPWFRYDFRQPFIIWTLESII